MSSPRTGRMISLVASTRAELLRLRRWPAFWTIVGVWLLLNLTFGYAFPYITYRSGGGGFGGDATPASLLLADVMPSAVPAAIVQGMPLFGGALMLVLGALVGGSGYGWGTWKTVFMQGPSRLAALGGTIAAVVTAVIGIVLATTLVDLGVSTILAAVEGEPIDLGSVSALAGALAGGVLISGMWALAGILLGTLARGPSLAVGFGIVWVLAVENLLRGVAGLLDWLQRITDVLPGTAAGSLAGAVGARPVDQPDGTPGVLTVLGGAQASLLLAAYAIVLTALAMALVRRRDLA